MLAHKISQWLLEMAVNVETITVLEKRGEEGVIWWYFEAGVSLIRRESLLVIREKGRILII